MSPPASAGSRPIPTRLSAPGVASASVAVARVRERSVVVQARSAGPLRLLCPANHGHAAWVYQSSLGGGFVGQDRLSLRVTVEPGSTLFLSSQASSKVYRGSTSRSQQEAEVGEGATLISWPDPVATQAGADFAQQQRFRLAAGANLLCVDAWSAGRVAQGERWAFERVRGSLGVEREGKRLLHEALELSSEAGPLAERFAGVEVFATVVLTGPALDSACEALLEAVRARGVQPGQPTVVASRWPWGLVLRVLAPSVQALHRVTRDLLQAHVAAALGDDPHARKW